MASSEFFKHETLEDCQSITRYLSALGEGFQGGQLMISTEDKKMQLSPGGLIKLEVEARRKNEEIKLTLKFHWVERRNESEEPGPKPLVISGGQES
jgi:amphi-Trp domain-containing protein